MYAITRSDYTQPLGAVGRTLEMAEIWLLVERSLIQAEWVDDVVDLHGSILNTLLGLFSRCVGTSICDPISVWVLLPREWLVLTDFDRTEGNHGTIDFVDNAIDFL
jgi:hypothetical protein